MNKLRPVVKIHGGKYYLASWIIENFPAEYQKYDYLEPFCGAASVLLNKDKPTSGIEVINDTNVGLIQIFRALRDEPTHFVKKLKKTRYSEHVFERELTTKRESEDYIDHAFNEFVLRRMSRGGLKKAFAWSERLRGGQPGDVNAWKTMLKELPDTADRISEVKILNEKAVKVIRAFDSENTLCYCDPPYLHNTRVSTKAYEDEMTDDDHIALADALNKFRGKVVISGYQSMLYKRLYADWKCVKKQVANHSSQQKTKSVKVECIWTNY